MTTDSPFTLVNAIMESKEPVPFDPKLYSPWLTNKALSQHIDTLAVAVEINQYGDLDPEMQYAYLFGSVRKFKRKRMPWYKPTKDATIELISTYYDCSLKKAEQMARYTTEEQLNIMQAALEKGGAKKK